MDVRLSDRHCLSPRLLEANGRSTRRVEGVLESLSSSSGTPTRRFVDAVDYDGHHCRYRIRCDRDERDARWVSENDASVYRPFSRLVVDRLCTFARDWTPHLHRFPGAPPSRALGRRLGRITRPYTLSVLDTCVTPDGRLWLRAALRGDAASGWRARHRPDDSHAEGWLVLAETVFGETTRAVARDPACRAEVA